MVHRRKSLGIAIAVLSIVLAGITAGCGGSTETQSAKSNAVLELACTADFVSGWDPRITGSTESVYILNMYENLMKANPPGSVEPYSPELATSWDVSDDGRVFTFHLREGVTFHDGTPFDADAVKYSFDAIQKLGQGWAYISAPVSNVKVVDKYTVKFTTGEPIGAEKILAGSAAVQIFSPATKGKSSQWWQGKDYGTGPYTIDSYKPGDEIVFKQYSGWWGGWKDNQFKKVAVKIVAEPGTQRQMLEAGEVDLAYNLSYDSVAAVEANPNLAMLSNPSQMQVSLTLNTKRPPLDDPKVRQALAYAVPYADCIELATNGHASQSRGFTPTGTFPFDESLFQYTYDLEKAKQLLAEAGYPGGKGIHKFVITYGSEIPITGKYVPLVKEAWGKLGIEVTLQAMPVAQYTARCRGPEAKRQDVVTERQWPAYPDGYDMMWYQFHSQPLSYNFAYWADPKFDKLLDEAFQTESTDLGKAQQLYNEAQAILIEQVPTIPVFDPEEIWAYSKTVKLQPGAVNSCFFSTLFWDKVTTN
jgi:peptide/nickel transport system substrate-binding protein